jgi:hypothetical protein
VGMESRIRRITKMLPAPSISQLMILRDRIAPSPGGGAVRSGGGWGGRSMSDRMEDRGGDRKDGFGGCGMAAEVTFVPTGLRNKARGCVDGGGATPGNLAGFGYREAVVSGGGCEESPGTDHPQCRWHREAIAVGPGVARGSSQPRALLPSPVGTEAPRKFRKPVVHNAVGVGNPSCGTRGSSRGLATPGFVTESRWDKGHEGSCMTDLV